MKIESDLHELLTSAAREYDQYGGDNDWAARTVAQLERAGFAVVRVGCVVTTRAERMAERDREVASRRALAEALIEDADDAYEASKYTKATALYLRALLMILETRDA